MNQLFVTSTPKEERFDIQLEVHQRTTFFRNGEPLHIIFQGKLLWFFHWHREDVFRFLSLYYFGRHRLVFFTWHEQPKIPQLDFPSQANNLLVQMILILEIKLRLLFQVMGEFNCYKSSMTFNPIYTWVTPESSSMCISQSGLEIEILDLASWVQLHEKRKQNSGQKKNCQFFHTSHNTHSRHVELLLNALRKILCCHQCLEYRGSNMWSK